MLVMRSDVDMALARVERGQGGVYEAWVLREWIDGESQRMASAKITTHVEHIADYDEVEAAYRHRIDFGALLNHS